MTELGRLDRRGFGQERQFIEMISPIRLTGRWTLLRGWQPMAGDGAFAIAGALIVAIVAVGLLVEHIRF